MSDLRLFVELDSSVEDWRPVCESCKQPIVSWSEAIGLPGALVEMDEPVFMLFAHRTCPHAEALNHVELSA